MISPQPISHLCDLVEKKMFKDIYNLLLQNKLAKDQSIVRLVLYMINFMTNNKCTSSDVLFLQRFFYDFNRRFSLDGVFCKAPKHFIRVMAKLYNNRIQRAKKTIFYASLNVIYNPAHPVGKICVEREIDTLLLMRYTSPVR